MTTRPTALLQRQSRGELVFPDSCKIRVGGCHVETDVLLGIDTFVGKSDAQGEVYAESASTENLFVQNTAGALLISGSLRNWAAAVGVVPADVPFGTSEVARTFSALNERLGLAGGTVERGRLTKLEVAADIVLPRPVSDYARAADDVPGTTPWRIGHRTVYHKAVKFEVRLYDKVEETLDRRRPLPTAFEGAHVARVEWVLHRGGVPLYFDSYRDEEGVVRAGLLADEGFRADLAASWAVRASTLRFGRVRCPAFIPATATDRARWHAVQHILANGGLSAELDRIASDVRAGRLKDQQGKDQKEAVRLLLRDDAYSSVADLDAEFAASVRAVVPGVIQLTLHTPA